MVALTVKSGGSKVPPAGVSAVIEKPVGVPALVETLRARAAEPRPPNKVAAAA